jgi:hypothetical protein
MSGAADFGVFPHLREPLLSRSSASSRFVMPFCLLGFAASTALGAPHARVLGFDRFAAFGHAVFAE